jgi:hypothetical protein
VELRVFLDFDLSVRGQADAGNWFAVLRVPKLGSRVVLPITMALLTFLKKISIVERTG